MPTGAENGAVALPEKRGREAAPFQLNLEDPPSWGSRSVDCFEKIEQIGEGTYGQVYQAKEKETDEIVALKKVRMDNEREGFPITAIREIKILKKLRHENVILLKEIVTSKASDSNKYKGSIYMVFEYMEHDLSGLSDRPGVQFSPGQIKCYMKQLLMGLHYCHINNVLHRDIKGSNLLINNDGRLKLADFGLARSAPDSDGPLTNRVITLWYRPPELLLGAVNYGQAVDMWSVGCIFAELLHKKPILPGKNEVEQLQLIFQLCGTPNEDNWPGFSRLPWAATKIPDRPLKRRIQEQFRDFDRDALNLVERLLTLDPEKRILAKEALDHDYFWTEPLAMELGSMPKYESSHEFQTKKRRQEERQRQENARRHGTGAHPQQQRQAHGGRMSGPQGQQAGGSGMHPPHRQAGGGGHAQSVHGHQPGTSAQPYHGPGGRQASGAGGGGGHGGHPSGSGRAPHQAVGAAAVGGGAQYSGRAPPLFGGQAQGFGPPPGGMGRGAPYAQPYPMPVPYGVYGPPMPPPPQHGVNPYGMPQYNDIDGTYARGAVNPYQQGRPLSPPHRQYDRQSGR